MTPALIAQVMEATWPAASCRPLGPWLIREGAGGGRRVSAATARGAWHRSDLPLAEDAMRAFGQTPLFTLTEEDRALDALLAARGYALVDPVVIYAGSAKALAQGHDPARAFPHWPPLAISREIWEAGHVGPPRLAIMGRVAGPKAAILARRGDEPAGMGFVACDGDQAMVHSVFTLPHARRAGLGRAIVAAAAAWAVERGAVQLSLAVTVANSPARALYENMGMAEVGGYHYREAQ